MVRRSPLLRYEEPAARDNRGPATDGLPSRVSQDLADFYLTQLGGRRGASAGSPPDALVFNSPYEGAGSTSSSLTLDRGLRRRTDALPDSLRTTDYQRLLDRTPDVPLSPEAAREKAEFRARLEKRFADNPERLKAVLKRLDEMDQRVLKQKDVRNENGDVVIGAKERQEQLAKSYRNLSRISDRAGDLTFVGSDGQERNVYSKQNVDTILADTICRAGQPKRFFNQGKTNCCAAESINGENALLLAGNYTEHIADICTEGKYRGKDKSGRTVEVNVDRQSLVLTGSASEFSLDPRNRESAAGRIGNTGLAQFNLALYAMDQGLPPDTYQYIRVAARRRHDTGERVVVNRACVDETGFHQRGEVISNSPIFTAENIARTKQAAFGYQIADDFGERTTLVSRTFARHGGAGVTLVGGGDKNLKDQLVQLRELGWDDATIITHTGNYYHSARGQGGSGICSGRSAGGLHATRIGLDDSDNPVWTGSWNGKENRAGLTCDQVTSWMNRPAGAQLALGGGELPFRLPGNLNLILPQILHRLQQQSDGSLDRGLTFTPNQNPDSNNAERRETTPRRLDSDERRNEPAADALRTEIRAALAELVRLRADIANRRNGDNDSRYLVSASQEVDVAQRLADFQYRLRAFV